MSGGAAVKAAGGVEGDHPVCTNSAEEDRGHALPAPAGLGLYSQGAAGPLLFKKAGEARRAAGPLFKKKRLQAANRSQPQAGQHKPRGIVTAQPRRRSSRRLGKPPASGA